MRTKCDVVAMVLAALMLAGTIAGSCVMFSAPQETTWKVQAQAETNQRADVERLLRMERVKWAMNKGSEEK